MGRLGMSALAACLLAAGPAFADEHDHEHEGARVQHEAHMHGAGTLGVAVEGSVLSVSLDAPGANFVGADQIPEEGDEDGLLAALTARLKDGASLFTPNEDAGCVLNSATVDIDRLSGEEHDEHESHAGHVDVEADYVFDCAHPGKLETLTVGLFSAFEGFEDIDAAVLTETGQAAQELSADQTVITLK